MMNDRTAATRGIVKISRSPCLNVHGASISESPAAASPVARRRDLLIELGEQRGDRRRLFGAHVLSRGGDVEDGMPEDGVAPVRDVGDVAGELSEGHRLLVRLPRQLRFRRPLEQPPRRPHLVVVLREQRILDRHAKENIPARQAPATYLSNPGRHGPVRSVIRRGCLRTNCVSIN